MRPEEIKSEVSKLALWQKQELDRRYNDYKENKLKLHDWKDVHAGLRDKYK